MSRVEWDLERFGLQEGDIKDAFRPLAESLGMDWALRFSDERLRIALFVSRLEHCLADLPHRRRIGELQGDFFAVMSNHDDVRHLAEGHGVPFHLFPITRENKKAQEQRELELLKSLQVDLIILARYMQILTEEFVSNYRNRIINIHHSFLPAFAGARPHAQAYTRGVKLIGATSHYVTGIVDDGPIIDQDVVRVSHRGYGRGYGS